jgi:hypothetical protein
MLLGAIEMSKKPFDPTAHDRQRSDDAVIAPSAVLARHPDD